MSSKNSSARKPRPPRASDPVEAYARAALGGKFVVGRLVKAACRRHIDDLARGARRGLVFDRDAAQRAIGFFGFLRHSKGEWAGRPVDLAPWQKFCIGSVFGWKRRNGTRRFRTVFEVVAKKNGKSTKLAGVALFCLVADGEPGAEVYSAATKRDQARIVFDEAKRMVRASPALRSRIQEVKLNLSVAQTNSKFEPLSSDDRTIDGVNPSCTVVDELHRHRSRALLDIMDAGQGARRQPLLWVITTSGDDNPESVYAQEYDYAVKVLDGVLHDDSFFAFIAALDPKDRWDDPSVWRKANPNLGISVKLDDLERQALKAKGSPPAQVAFKRFRLNIVTSSAQRAIDMAVWARNGIDFIDPDSLAGRDCYLAVDLSSKVDLSATVKLFPPKEENERWKVLANFWMPADNVQAKQDRDRAPYSQWIERHWITTTPGNVIDHAAIRSAVLEDARKYRILSLPYDPWNATQMALELQAEGLPVVEFIQGLKSYTAPTKELLAWLLSDKLDHGDNPVLTWMASNLAVQTDKNENMMPTKQRSTGRIDGMTALIMCIGRHLAAPGEPHGRSIYEIPEAWQ